MPLKSPYEQEFQGHRIYDHDDEDTWFVLRGPLGGVFRSRSGQWFYFRNIPSVQEGHAIDSFDHMGGKLANSKEDALFKLRQEIRDEYYQSRARVGPVPPDVGEVEPEHIDVPAPAPQLGRPRTLTRIIED